MRRKGRKGKEVKKNRECKNRTEERREVGERHYFRGRKEEREEGERKVRLGGKSQRKKGREDKQWRAGKGSRK